MRRAKSIGFILILVIAILQFVPSKLPEKVENNPNDLLANHEVPDSIVTLLKNSCYDCHSNLTNYPWYSYVAPVSWLVGRDTREGRNHLNLSEWESYSIKEKLKMLTEIAEVVESKEMPMPVYQLMHSSAKLSENERTKLINWSEHLSDQLLE